MRICGREYRLRFDSEDDGAGFRTGCDYPEIVLGLGCKSLHHVVSNLVHEIFEATLCEEGKRWGHDEVPDDCTRKMFVFEHDYLHVLGPKLLDAMLSSGFFRLVDGRPGMGRKRGGKKGKGCGK